MTTIVLLVSRQEFLERVCSRIELLNCNSSETNILCVVDGDAALYVKARNTINGMKFAQRLTVPLDVPGSTQRFNIGTRRARISAAHNQARSLISSSTKYVFSVEDDTLVPNTALETLTQVAIRHRAFGAAVGVELGRWGVPYVGAWNADDVYEPTKIVSVENKFTVDSAPDQNIDASGLYCTLIRADLYRDHNFTSSNGLGPDINLGLELRRLGYENFISWDVGCVHLNTIFGLEVPISPSDESKIVTLTKMSDTKWKTTY